MAPQHFTATLEDSGRGGGRWVELPFDPRAVFGEARAPVRGTVNGAPIRSRTMIYGGRPYLGLTAAVRAAAGVETGDLVRVVLDRDDEPRVVEVPPALAAALAGDAAARAAFDALAHTHRREYAQWIAEAKREETRARRVDRALVMLRQGTKHP